MSRASSETDRIAVLRDEFLRGVRETLVAWQRDRRTDLPPSRPWENEADHARRDGARVALAWLGIERAIDPWLERYGVTRWQFLHSLQDPNA